MGRRSTTLTRAPHITVSEGSPFVTTVSAGPESGIRCLLALRAVVPVVPLGLSDADLVLLRLCDKVIRGCIRARDGARIQL